MFMSRFWYLVLSVVTVVALVSTSIVTSTYQRDRARDAETLLRGDRQQIDNFLRTDARVRLDNLTPVGANPELSRLLNACLTRANDGGALQSHSQRINTQLRSLNDGLGEAARGQMLFAVDSRGILVGRTGLQETSGLGDFVGGLPLIDRALRGYVRDDVWEIQGRVYRMSARPILYQGRYVGVVVHAREIDQAFVQRISEALGGASVGFFTAQSMYASHQGDSDHEREAPRPESLTESLRALEQNQQWRTRGYTDVMQVQNGAGAVVYGHVAGTVGLVGGGFVVGRPRPELPSNYLLHAPRDEVRRVPWGVYVGLGLGGFLLGMLWLFLEHDQGSRGLHKMLTELAARKIERLDPLLLRGNARRMALAINEAFEAAMKAELARGGGAPPRSVQDLDALLDASKPALGQVLDIPPPPPAGLGGPAPLSFPPSKPPAPVGPPIKPPAPTPSVRNMPPPPAAAPLPPPVPTPAIGVAMVTPPAPPVAPPAPPAVPGAPVGGAAPAPPQSVMVSMADLASAAAGVSAPQGFASEEEELAHWRAVFDEFVTTKKQCNEPTESLIFDRFKNTLERNKKTLVEKNGAKAVRFSVYVKDGKATLKATPVK